MKILIVASGGGHTGHAVALAEHLLEAGYHVDFIIPRGDKWSLLKLHRYGDIVAETPKPIQPGEQLAQAVHRLPLALVETLHRIPCGYDILFSTGSSHSVVAAIAAKLKCRMKVIHVEATERLATLSSSTWILAPIASTIVAQWPEQVLLMRRHGIDRIAYTGPILEKPKYKPWNGGYILVTTGSQGYPQLLDTIHKLYREGKLTHRLVMQTGRVDPARYRERGIIAFRFDPDLHRWLAGAELVITHFGRTVIDAALTYNKPTVIVPNPEWTIRGRGARIEDAVLLARKLCIKVATPRHLHSILPRAALKPCRHQFRKTTLRELVESIAGEDM